MGLREARAVDEAPQLGAVVRLDLCEVQMAATAGVLRRVEAMRRGRQDGHGLDPRGGLGWSLDIEGAAAEAAFAKYRGLYWPAVVDDPSKLPGDVGVAEIRQTAEPDGHLILHESDHDDRPYVLVVGQVPEFRIVGWIRGADGKLARWHRTSIPRPAFFVPQGALEQFRDVS